MSERSCVTTTTAPGHCESASSSTSLPARARWCVGSSMSSRLLGVSRSRARATRWRSPPDSTRQRLKTSSPENRNVPSRLRRRGRHSSLATSSSAASTVSVPSSVSAACCAKYPVRVNGGRSRPPPPGPRHELAGEEPEQRRLAGPVRAHDRELLAVLDLDPGVRDHVWRVAVAERQVAQPYERAAGVGRGREREADAARRARNDHVLLLQPLDLLPLALRGRRLRVLGAEALHEALELRDLRLDLGVARRRALAAELLLLEIEREAHGVGRELSLVELADLGGDAVQEDAVVRHHDEPPAEVLEIVLEPLHGGQIQVIRRLVHEQHGRVREEQRRERGAHAPAAGELGERAVLVGGGEAEPRKDAARLGLERVLVVVFEVMLQVAHTVEQGGEPGIVGAHAAQLLVQRVELDAHVEERAVRLHGALEHAALVALGRLLRQVADPGAARPHAQSALGCVLAEDEADERGLAGPVRTHQSAAVARADHPVDAVEEHPLPDAVAKALELDHRSAPAGRPKAPLKAEIPFADRIAAIDAGSASTG